MPVLLPISGGMMTDSLKFGTSGLRGLATDLVGAPSARYALAFISHLRTSAQVGATGAVIVGRDLRASSPEISASVIGAIWQSGLTAVDCGEVPTPALALLAQTQAAPAIMVTGSHIPGDRNGLKFYVPTGEITKDDEAGIVAALRPVVSEGSRPGRVEAGDALGPYLERCRGLVRAGSLAGKRIGIWQHSSVFRDPLHTLFTAFGCDVYPLGRERSFRAVDTEAVSATDAAQIKSWVLEHKLDALVSTDGDADRPLLADETGAVVRGDVLGLLTARYLKADAVVTPVTSTSAIEQTGYFATALRTRVGSPFVIAGMAEAKRAGGVRVVGFEANGGVLLGSSVFVHGHELGALPTRDAMLPVLSVLALAEEQGKTLSQLVAALPPRFSRSDRLEHVASERSAALLAMLNSGFFTELGEVAAVSEVDGMRFSFTSGDVVHYRPSGNAPELRCYSEAATAERADELLAWGIAAAERVVR